MIYSGEIGLTVLDNFIAEPERLDVLEQFDDMESLTVCTEDGAGELHNSRTVNRKFIPYDITPMCEMMCERISLLVGIPMSHAEKIQLLHYEHGEKYLPHFDAFDQNSPQWEHYGIGGQRIITAMGYLTDVRVGGETSFPTLGIDVRPRKRRLLVFNDVTDDVTKAHPDSLHGGMPVGEGTKKCFTIWFREQPINNAV